jgi:iron transport multicopper oxidase
VNVAILRYKGATLADPSPAADVNIPLLKNTLVEDNLRPLVDVPVPGVHELGKADVTYTLRTDYNTHGNGLFTMGATGGVNETFIPSATPILLQILSGARQAKDLLPNGAIYTLPSHKV